MFVETWKTVIYSENLALDETETTTADGGSPEPQSETAKLQPTAAIPLIQAALGQLEDLDGWYPLSAVGSRLLAEMPDFDPRSYGCAKLVSLIEKSGAFNVRRDQLRSDKRRVGKGCVSKCISRWW